MRSPYEDLIAGLEIQIVHSVEAHQAAERARRYVEVLEFEDRIARMHTALAIAADRLASGS